MRPFVLGLTLVACSSGATPDSRPPEDAAIEARAARFAGFSKITRARYPTRQHLGNPLVDIYATAEAESAYRAIDPGAVRGGSTKFPVGSMLVKTMYDDNGEVASLTVMYKKPPGYDPSHGDWWYGRLHPNGEPTDPAYVGKVDFCMGCHAAAAATDYAFGVDRANL